MPRSASRLRRTILIIGAPVAVVVIGIITFLATRGTIAEMARTQTDLLIFSGVRASSVVTQYLGERRADVSQLASMPSVIQAARAGTDLASRQGLASLSITALEDRFASTRQLGADSALVSFLQAFRDQTDFDEVFFTERSGLSVAATNLTSDFVQVDEEWWQIAFRDGAYQTAPTFDESSGVVAVEFSYRIPGDSVGYGVLKGTLGLARLGQLLGVGDPTGGTRAEVVDSAGQVVLSRDPTTLLGVTANADQITFDAQPRVDTVDTNGGREVVATVPTDNGRWWVVVREDEAAMRAPIVAVTRSAYITGGVLLVFAMVVLVTVTGWLDNRVTQPVRTAGTIARRVADGDLSVGVVSVAAGGAEVSDLIESVNKMVAALSKLVGAIRSSADEAAAMAEQISASTEEMSASTEEMASTCQHLSHQASAQAAMIRDTANDANEILNIASHLAEGTTSAVDRNAALQSAAERHRDRLLESGARLSQLTDDIAHGAAEAETLAQMSEEIQQFVTQTRGIAAQTNMLSLNASIEAARATDGEGRGFAVVADEVRKLATQAARAASMTSETVSKVLQTVQSTRERLQRIAEGNTAVQEIAASAADGLREVADAAGDSRRWTDDISSSADQARQLVQEISTRLHEISTQTDAFLAASEQIAASSEEQTASTQEIAASAAQLAEISERLTTDVATFRLRHAVATDNADPALPSG